MRETLKKQQLIATLDPNPKEETKNIMYLYNIHDMCEKIGNLNTYWISDDTKELLLNFHLALINGNGIF